MTSFFSKELSGITSWRCPFSFLLFWEAKFMFFHNLNRISDFWCTYQLPWPNLNPGSTILPDPLEPNLNPRSTILPDPPAPNSNPDFGTLLDHSQPKIHGKSSFLPFIFLFRLFLTNCVPLCCQLMGILIILGRSIRRRILITILSLEKFHWLFGCMVHLLHQGNFETWRWLRLAKNVVPLLYFSPFLFAAECFMYIEANKSM